MESFQQMLNMKADVLNLLQQSGVHTPTRVWFIEASVWSNKAENVDSLYNYTENFNKLSG